MNVQHITTHNDQVEDEFQSEFVSKPLTTAEEARRRFKEAVIRQMDEEMEFGFIPGVEYID